MSGALPASIDPIRLADRGDYLTGTIPLKGMKRLLANCGSDEGVVTVDLSFRNDGNHHARTITGSVQTEISLNCERCLEPMSVALQCEVSLLVLLPGQEGLVEEDEALIVNGPVSLAELVENELILSLPMIPMHAMDQCPATNRKTGKERPEPGQGSSKESPFAELAKLKRSDRE